jgi:rSAM/selenodomain-associated transferase 1
MVDLAGAAVAAVLTRAPSAGGKSRLFHSLGLPPDPALLSALLLDTVAAVRASGSTAIIAVEPPHSCAEVRALVPGIEVVPQPSGPLGARMAAVMRMAFDRGAAATALVGSDLPDLVPDVLTDAFAALQAHPLSVVLGPAADGGYYLIASTRVPDMFDGIEWGTPRVLDQTLAAARQQGIETHLLRPMEDVDGVAELLRVAAPRTRAWVEGNL